MPQWIQSIFWFFVFDFAVVGAVFTFLFLKTTFSITYSEIFGFCVLIMVFLIGIVATHDIRKTLNAPRDTTDLL